jgi:exopolysaccharide biosynthesis protein
MTMQITGGELIIDNGSYFELNGKSRIDLYGRGKIIVKNGGILHLKNSSEINVAKKGRIIFEKGGILKNDEGGVIKKKWKME